MNTATITPGTTLFAANTFSTKSALNWVVDCVRVAHQRRVLSTLTLSALEDIGVSEVEAKRESTKPFWA